MPPVSAPPTLRLRAAVPDGGHESSMEAARRVLRDAQHQAASLAMEEAQEHKAWLKSLPRPKVSPARRASMKRSYLASVMNLDRPDDLPRALAQGLNPKVRGPDKLSLLAAAVSSGSVNAVRLLLAAGADPNQVGACRPGLQEKTPLEYVLGRDEREGVDLAKLDLLLAAGADPNAMGPRSIVRPLQRVVGQAERYPWAQAAMLRLLDAGADPHLLNREGGCAWTQAEPELRVVMQARRVAHEARVLMALAQDANDDLAPARPRGRL